MVIFFQPNPEAPLSRPEPLVAVVDDDESVCRALDRLLHSIGMNTRTFSSGSDFLDYIEAIPSFHPDCVVLDLHMPGLDGLDVQERLIKSGIPVSIIFITAHDEAGARDLALKGGAVAFLPKPFSDEVLIKALDEAIYRRLGP
jgi:FixJ family two-component response regulator